MSRRSLSSRTGLTLSLSLVMLAVSAPRAEAFCGFYVARADASLFNSASRVVIVHDEGNTVLTMVNDYRGEPRSFAIVVPVPVVMEKEMVRVVDPKVVDHLDGFTAPRLVEYFDSDPCYRPKRRMELERSASVPMAAKSMEDKADRARSLGVKIEASYTVGEYDIEVLSAKQSNGLEIYLRENKYNIPSGASAALAPYIRSGMKFFVAKVNLKEQAKTGFSSLRPLQFAFPDQRFMLPIRLGMLNADGPQDLIVYAISKQHRIEVTNYRNPKLPSDMDVPTFIKDDFKRFYRDLFTRSLAKESDRAVFTEHAWNMGWCDPCAAEPLTKDELEQLGVWWLEGNGMGGGAQQAFVTRLHARYTPETFPEDLMLKVTKDAGNFQARYVLRHAWTGTEWCEQMPAYLDGVKQRREKEITTLATLTGWDPSEIRSKMKPLPKIQGAPEPESGDPAWKNRIRDLFKGKGG
ncbi:DUF2330 domain-containing protein [Myxococcota bacterium]|nr:DUF2330 domain-containing protein [Myxococcota bacterium]